MLQKVVNSSSNIAAYDILNQDCTNQVQGHHGVGSVAFEIKGELLRLNFLPTLDFNQEGKNADYIQEMIIQEKQEKEVVLTIGLVAGRLAELKLAMKVTNQEMLTLPVSKNRASSWDLDNLRKNFFGGCDSGEGTNGSEGTSNVIANEANMKSSLDETCIVQNYKVFNRNANVLTEIFKKHPNIDENFRVAHPDLQSPFMNSLAEVYEKIKSERKILELDITSMEVMVQDMEDTGLQLSWLKEMLIEVRERLENQAKKKRLVELIDSRRAKAKEAELVAKKAEQEAKEAELELELAKLEKKPRFQ